MAELRLPVSCEVCHVPFAEGDKIVLERRAKVEYPITFHLDKDPASPEFNTWVERPNYNRPLQPRIEARSPRNVRHLECAQ